MNKTDLQVIKSKFPEINVNPLATIAKNQLPWHLQTKKLVMVPAKAKKPLEAYWWLTFFRLSYFIGLLPVKIAKEEDGEYEDRGRYKIHCNKFRKLFQGIIGLVIFLSIIWNLVNIHACRDKNFQTYLNLVVRCGDFAKFYAMLHITWTKLELVSKILSASYRHDYQTPVYALFIPWVISMGYIGVHVVVRIANTQDSALQRESLLSVETFCRSLSMAFFECDESSDTFKIPFPYLLALASLYGIYFVYVVLSDAFVFSTAGLYCSLAGQLSRRLQEALDTPTETKNKPEILLEEVKEFQAQIQRINCTTERLLLICFVSDLPYYIFRSIPALLSGEQDSLHIAASCLYISAFMGSVLLSGAKHSALTEVLQNWIGRNMDSSVGQQYPKYLLLQSHLNSNHNFALSLNGFGQITSSFFVSIVGVTFTYTVIYYQFQVCH